MKNSKTTCASWLLRATLRACTKEQLAFLEQRARAPKSKEKFSKLEIPAKVPDPSDESAPAAQTDARQPRRSGRVKAENTQVSEAQKLEVTSLMAKEIKRQVGLAVKAAVSKLVPAPTKSPAAGSHHCDQHSSPRAHHHHAYNHSSRSRRRSRKRSRSRSSSELPSRSPSPRSRAHAARLPRFTVIDTVVPGHTTSTFTIVLRALAIVLVLGRAQALRRRRCALSITSIVRTTGTRTVIPGSDVCTSVVLDSM